MEYGEDNRNRGLEFSRDDPKACKLDMDTTHSYKVKKGTTNEIRMKVSKSPHHNAWMWNDEWDWRMLHYDEVEQTEASGPAPALDLTGSIGCTTKEERERSNDTKRAGRIGSVYLSSKVLSCSVLGSI